MLITGLSSTVRRANEVRRETSHNAYSFLLSKLDHPQRHFLEKGQGTPPYVDVGFEISYINPNKFKEQRSRYVAFSGDLKNYLKNCYHWNNVYLLHQAKFNRFFSVDAFHQLMHRAEFKYLSELVIMSKMKLLDFDTMKHLDLKHLSHLNITVDGPLTDTMARIILEDWQYRKGLALTIHCPDDKMVDSTYFKFADHPFFNIVRYGYRHTNVVQQEN